MISQEFYKENGSSLVLEILASEDDDFDGGICFPLHPDIKFYFLEDGKVIAVDNADCQCFIEEFDSEEQAIRWLNEV